MTTLTAPAAGTEPRTARAAALTLAAQAHNPGDLRNLLEACGLITPVTEVPRDHEGRTIGRCPSCQRVKRLTLTGLLNAHDIHGSAGVRCHGGGRAPVRI